MDHSYSTERERLQKSDHSYFTVAKKTPQVVLRRAQQLKEQTVELTKSAICQDHSYVRATELLSHPVDDVDIEHANLLLDLFHCHQQLKHIPPPSAAMEPLTNSSCEAPECHAMQSSVTSYTEDNNTICSRQRQSDLDELRCWIGCIQLDHAYDGPGLPLSSCSDLEAVICCDNSLSGAAYAYDRRASNVVIDTSLGGSGVAVDHTYDGRDSSGASDSNSTSGHENCMCDVIGREDQLSHYDTSYNDCQDLCIDDDDNDDALDRRNISVDQQHWDHAYDLRCGSKVSLTHGNRGGIDSGSQHHLDHSYGGVTSGCSVGIGGGAGNGGGTLQNWDHAYVGRTCGGLGQSAVGVNRSTNSTSRWSSSDDIRAASRTAEPVRRRVEPVSMSLHQLIS